MILPTMTYFPMSRTIWWELTTRARVRFVSLLYSYSVVHNVWMYELNIKYTCVTVLVYVMKRSRSS